MIGKLQASLAQATNEVTVAAANLNFDFCLVKYEAPREYQPLGQLLSTRRKQDAEFGKSHVTARRLAALFQGLCPETPKLTAAYGERVSDISQLATDNASKDYSSSIFEAYTGVDATSIWAAATSTKDSKNNAIHVHLLACILTVWEPAEAVSIWFELVQERRRKIAKDLEEGAAMPFSMAAAAAQQEITRSQLGEWDASARSRMQTADTVMVKKQTQLKLVLKNIPLPVRKSEVVYNSVTEVWHATLLLMERLLSGMPQEVQDGSTLLGLITWHLYPDIVVFGSQTVEIKMADSLVPNGGVLSLGCSSSATMPNDGVAWSLSLAHLRHYGHPVQKDALYILGCVLELWSVNQERQAATLDLLVHLSQHTEKDDVGGLNTVLKGAFKLLETAVEQFRQDEENGQRLIANIGRKRVGFLKRPSSQQIEDVKANPKPYFGLLLAHNFMRLLRTQDQVISYLRHVGQKWEALKSTTPLIRLGYWGQNAYIYKKEKEEDEEEDEEEHEEEHEEERKFVERRSEADFVTLFPIQNGISSSSNPNTGNHIRWSTYEDPHLKHHNTQWHDNISFQQLEASTFVKEPAADHIVSGRYSLIYGDINIGGVFVPDDWRKSCEYREPPESFLSSRIDHQDAAWAFEHDLTSFRTLTEQKWWDELIKPLHYLYYGISTLSSIHQRIISIEALRQPVMNCFWTHSIINHEREVVGTVSPSLSLATQASVISYFAGGCNVHPDDISWNVSGISVGDSLIVPNRLLDDPFQAHRGSACFVRILGNIGQPGLVIFSSVQSPMSAKLDQSNWRFANQQVFNGMRENALGSTSMHLSFTNWKHAIDQVKEHGTQDSQCHKMESVISIREKGRWIGDVDVMAALRSNNVYFMAPQPPCTHSPNAAPLQDMQSIESWNGLSDISAGLVVVRAHGSWLARLAATAFLAQQGNMEQSFVRRITVCPPNVCWQCHKPEFTGNVYIY
ncbi:hypothetical protein F4860DRAFT_506763 [Xylaria cubensis]|nr:hypothetical protein F4860DRAFT_506763 [Xylaria cubensis]